MSAAKAGAASAMRAAALRKIFFMGVPLGTQRAHCLGFCTQNVCCRGATGQVNRLVRQKDEIGPKCSETAQWRAKRVLAPLRRSAGLQVTGGRRQRFPADATAGS